MLLDCEWDRLLDEGTIEDLYETYLDYDRQGYVAHVPTDVLIRLDEAGYSVADWRDPEDNYWGENEDDNIWSIEEDDDE